MLEKLKSERGHVGSGLPVLLALAALVMLPLGLASGNDGLAAADGALLALAVVIGALAPHLWVRKIWARIDRDDPDANNMKFEF